jgi:TolB protein
MKPLRASRAVLFFSVAATAAAALGVLLSLALPSSLSAETDVRLRITSEGYTKIRLGIEESKVDSNLRQKYSDFLDVIRNDLDMSGYFEILEARDLATANVTVQAAVESDKGDLSFEVTLSDKLARTDIFKRKYRSGSGSVEVAGHLAAEEIIFALTGRHGLANTRIAFVAGERGNSRLYMAYLDGSLPVELTHTGGIVMSPSWSPDGERLAYVSFASGTPAIYVMDVSSLKVTRFASFPGLNGMPAWSPDGRSLAVALSKDGNPEIYVLSLDGSMQKRVTTYSGIDCSPTWAPNGLEIAFTSDRAGTPQIFVTDIEGLGVRRVTFEGNYNTSPAWSPDGALIAYVSRIDGKFQICTVDPFGVSSRVLTSSGNNEDPYWSADGMHLAFSSTGDGNSGIYMVPRDGGKKRKLVDGFTRPRNPAWSPPRGYLKPLAEGRTQGGD